MISPRAGQEIMGSILNCGTLAMSIGQQPWERGLTGKLVEPVFAEIKVCMAIMSRL